MALACSWCLRIEEQLEEESCTKPGDLAVQPGKCPGVDGANSDRGASAQAPTRNFLSEKLYRSVAG